MKRKYFVLDTMNPDNNLYYTVVCPVSVECDNVMSKLQSWSGKNIIKFSMLCDTKKRAAEICESWRMSHIENGNSEIF